MRLCRAIIGALLFEVRGEGNGDKMTPLLIGFKR